MRLKGAILATCVCVVWPGIADAQSPLQLPPARVEKTWAVAVQVGVGTTTTPSGVTGVLPPAGPAIAIGGSSSTRQVPSWFFGDGATVLNANLSRNLFAARLTPLDEILTSSSAHIGRGVNLNATVSRLVSPRFAVEFNVSLASESLALTDHAVSQANQTLASFENSFDDLIPLMSTQELGVVTTNFDVDEPSGMQIMTGGALRFYLANKSSTKPYVLVGGGVTLVSGDNLVATLSGTYDFVRRISPLPRIRQTDSVAIRYHANSSWYASFGGGLTRDLGSRYGIRAEVLLNLFPDRLKISIDTSPSNFVSDPAGFAALTGNPGLLFSNTPTTPTNLALALDDFETFSGSGTRLSTRVTAGIFFRF